MKKEWMVTTGQEDGGHDRGIGGAGKNTRISAIITILSPENDKGFPDTNLPSKQPTRVYHITRSSLAECPSNIVESKTAPEKTKLPIWILQPRGDQETPNPENRGPQLMLAPIFQYQGVSRTREDSSRSSNRCQEYHPSYKKESGEKRAPMEQADLAGGEVCAAESRQTV
ncbi:hypothetical protein M413DRAFT_32650 [Hebeloma cylindrosporum]|uniref:Uncharacterized protein n=1 Tax=Hebeloma cylindrosporum TaxID=76867 RepID=A0A0C3BV24_HEBCY|nr:hypothetical protein M413DRAFT_32650 [Hebeloma cylindrosporum h7]